MAPVSLREPSFTFIPLKRFLSPPSDAPVNVKCNTVLHVYCAFKLVCVCSPQPWEGLCFSFFSRRNFSLRVFVTHEAPHVNDCLAQDSDSGSKLPFLTCWPQTCFLCFLATGKIQSHPHLSTMARAFDMARTLSQLLPKILGERAGPEKQMWKTQW